MKRRKGKRRPPVVGRNCKWLTDGTDCRLKIIANGIRDGAKRKRSLAYDNVNCSKCRYCGFEEKIQHEMPVKDIRNEIGRLEEILARLKKLVQNGD